MTFGAVFPRVLRPVFGPGLAVSAAAANWWEAGGATGAVAVYQPKGAASLAASYVNLANPGTYGAAPGTAPTWATGTGWTFNGSTQYLDTGLTPSGTQSWSQIVRYANVADTFGGQQWLCGAIGGPGTYMMLTPNYDGSSHNWRIYRSKTQAIVSGRQSSGVMATAGTGCYLNGGSDGTLSGGSGALSYSYYLGCVNNGGTPQFFQAADILAFAIYNTVLTAPQVAAISTAMAAL